MESIVLESLVSTIVENLISLAHEEVRLFVCFASDVEKLKETFQSIQDVLVDAQHKQVTDQAVKRWLSKVRDVAYDVDDVLDEWNTEILISKMNIQVCKFISPCFCFNQIVFRCKMGHKIKGVRERVDEIFKQMSPFDFVRTVDNVVASGQVMEERIPTSQVYEAEVFGREKDEERIVDLLLHESSQQEENLSIISVVGMCGLGKTTLAQLAYNNVKGHFKVTMWVCVSNDFSLIRLTKAMIESIPKEESITKEPANFNELDPLESCQKILREELYGKRFLLVLDDVWNEESEKWDRLRVPLMVGAKGSRILITTRKKEVAKVMGTNYIHYLKGLSEEKGWVLFRHRAFYGRSEKEMRELEEMRGLEEIGKEIVKECKGLPLAIKTIGSVMRSKKTRQEWEEIRESDIWRLNVEMEILPVLMSSYQDLPPHLRQCFAYCSIFPKDYRIEKIKLIYMWMAQGYLLAKNGKEMEELGDSYFDELLGRSLFQEPKIDKVDGSIESCKMHDMVSDLAQSITGKECSIIEFDKAIEDPVIKVRHLSFVATSDGESIPNSLRKPNHLRTINCIGKSNISNISMNLQDLFKYSTRLRVLDLSWTRIEEVPDSIGNLKHLRYLDLSNTNIKELPESTNSLRNLMVLRLDLCGHLEKLPEGIGRITSLRTLDFIAGDNKGGSKIGELKKLNLLRSLSIDGLKRVRKGDDAKEAAMEEKKHLHTLTLTWGGDADAEEAKDGLKCLHTLRLIWRTDEEEENDDEMGKQAAEDVLECLKPHTSLMKLTIWDYNGDRFPSWIGDQLFSNLTFVELYNCRECEVLPPLGQLPSLKCLLLWGMEKVKSVGSDLYGSAAGGAGVKGLFPKLERLNLFRMEELEEWELRVLEGGEIMPSLLHLRIEWCSKLKSLPPQLLSTLKELQILYCGLLEKRYIEGGVDHDKIAHIPNITIESWP